MAESLSTNGRPSRLASRLPTVDLPAPINPTRTIGRSSRFDSFSTRRGYTLAYMVGQKGRHVATNADLDRPHPPRLRGRLLFVIQRPRGASRDTRDRSQP